ncbi:MAG: hypothetical protein NPIRA04_28390 [Nitrospirales bacterium]|nr:MAG: hypothetical protein NPIRA04_28390 [Nitrospirales bacterium]
MLTDSSGVSEQDVAYYPYGDTRSNTGTADVAYKYTGKEQDDSTGLYFYEARYYDPVLGRFISPDTIVPNPGNPQSLNRYSYVLNNPLRYTDPSGQVPITLGRGEITIPLGDNVGTLTVTSDFGFGYVGSGVPGGQLDITFDPVVYAILGLVPESVRAVLLKFIIEDRPKLYSVSSSGADFSSLANSSGSDSAEVQPLNVPFVVPQTSGAGSRRGEFFIQQPVVAGFLGDGRPRDPSPNPDQSRAFFDVNFDTGSGRFRVNPSCLAAGACFSAFPRGGGNSLDIFQSDNAVIITGTVTNSAVPLFPNIFVPSITFYFKRHC